MRLIIIAALVSLAACAPKMAFSNEAGGVINKTGSMGNDRVYVMATEHCAKFGKVPRFGNRDILTNKQSFDCVTK